MIFDYPRILYALFLLIPLFIYDILRSVYKPWFTQRHAPQIKNTEGTRFTSVYTAKSPAYNKSGRKFIASIIFFRLFLALAIIALAGPRWGTGFSPAEYFRGLDIVFAVDVSRSMDIRDAYEENLPPAFSSQQGALQQSRLERGLIIARETIISMPGARVAAAVGRSRGYLAVPLTYDNESALIFLEALDGSSMTGRSTNIESLIEASAEAFQSSSSARKVIVLISDGESHSGVLRNILNVCAREGIIIIAVGVGSDEGRLISPLADQSGQQPVISRRDAAVMRNIAERTNGIYIDGSRQDAPLNLSSHLISIATETNPLNRSDETKQRRSLFIMLALAAYAVSKFVTRSFTPRGSKLASIVSIILMLSSCSEGKILLMEANYLHSRGRFDEAILSYTKALDHDDASPYAEYGLGLTFYLMDQEDAALNRYNDSRSLLETLPDAEHRELRYRNYYNSGIIYFEKQEYQSAAAAFREALKAEPRRIEAKRNLELSILSINMETSSQNNSENRQEQKEILFDYLRDEEQQVWRSREWTAEEDFTGPDY